jgi:hypothetical protein
MTNIYAFAIFVLLIVAYAFAKVRARTFLQRHSKLLIRSGSAIFVAAWIAYFIALIFGDEIGVPQLSDTTGKAVMSGWLDIQVAGVLLTLLGRTGARH